MQLQIWELPPAQLNLAEETDFEFQIIMEGGRIYF